jgi:hypothetical protein
MPKQQTPKPQRVPSPNRRTRGKVQPPKVRQASEYWEDLFQRCLDDYERATGAQTRAVEPRTEGESDSTR